MATKSGHASFLCRQSYYNLDTCCCGTTVTCPVSTFPVWANLGSPTATIFQSAVNFGVGDLSLTNNEVTVSMADSWDGYVSVVKPGDYTFYLSSSDGSQLYIDGTLVVSNGGAALI